MSSACTAITSAQTLNSITGSLARKNPNSRFKELIDDNSKLKSLEEIPATGAANFRFPLNLSDEDHWISFRVESERRFRAKNTPVSATQCFITLPVPTNLQTAYNSGYENEDLGLIGGTITGNENLTAAQIDEKFSPSELAKSAGAAITQSGELGALVAGGVANLAGGGTIATLLAGGAGAAVTQGIGAKIAKAGFARNPHQAVLFKGTGFRSHSFQYKFIAQNAEESAAITDIITAFKFYMAPKLTQSTHFFEYPEQFDIDLKNTEHLFDIGTSVLTSFGVNYHGEGEPIYFRGGQGGSAAPYAVTIDMTFQEVTITTKDEIAKRGR